MLISPFLGRGASLVAPALSARTTKSCAGLLHTTLSKLIVWNTEWHALIHWKTQVGNNPGILARCRLSKMISHCRFTISISVVLWESKSIAQNCASILISDGAPASDEPDLQTIATTFITNPEGEERCVFLDGRFVTSSF